MSYDDVDNRIRSASAGYVTAEGHLLYVYDSTSGMTDGGAAFAVDATSDVDAPQPRVTRIDDLSNIADIPGGTTDADDDALDSFSALFLAYDAADAASYPTFDEEFDDDDELDGDAGTDEAHAIASAWQMSRGRHDDDLWLTDRPAHDGRELTIGEMLANGALDDADDATDDAAAMSALMDALVVAEDAEGAQARDAHDQSPPAASFEPAAHASVAQEPPGYDVVAVPAHQQGGARARPAEGGAVTVSEIAAASPEAQAAFAALKVRRAQARRRQGAYVFMAVGVVVVAALSLFVNYLLSLDEHVAAVAGGVATVAREDFAITVTGNATLEAVDAVDVRPMVSGTVDEIYVSEGDLVEAGNVLLTLSNADTARAIDEATAALDSANDELARAKAAVIGAYSAYNSEVDSYRAGTNPSFDEQALLRVIADAEAAHAAAHARAEAARTALEQANAEVAQCDVTAPTSGAVANLRVEPGMALEAGELGEPALQIADVGRLRVRVQLPANQMAGVTAGSAATVALAALPDISSPATVESVDDATAAESGLCTVSLLVDAPDARLRPGAEVIASIITGVDENALVIPVAALNADGDDEASVWVVTDTDTGHTERRQVSVGARGSSKVEILDGLAEGEIVGLPSS